MPRDQLSLAVRHPLRLARRAAQQMMQAALERAVEESWHHQRSRRQGTEQECRGYRHGSGRERSVPLGSGTISVRTLRVADVPKDQAPFESRIVTRYQKRSHPVGELFPQLSAENRSRAERLATHLAREWQGQYTTAVECLMRDVEARVRFVDYPPEHWKHLRTTDPIESGCAPVRLPTDGRSGCGRPAVASI